MAATYLDSSAIVKLVIAEPESSALRKFLRRRRPLVASALARTEVTRAVLGEVNQGSRGVVSCSLGWTFCESATESSRQPEHSSRPSSGRSMRSTCQPPASSDRTSGTPRPTTTACTTPHASSA